jgi:lysophospholipase L1-like esterase
MKHYLPTHLAEERPDVAIIHGGGNDIPCGKNQKVSLLDVANNIIDMGHICKQYGVSRVCISSVLPRDDFHFQFRRTELNDLLRDMCVLNNFEFMENPTFALCQHIHVDGVHLNKRGSSLLASNYLQFLYNVLCPPAA